MIPYVLRRSFQMVPVVILVSISVFAILRLVPGDPAEVAAGENASQERVEEIREDLGLDRPIYQQYVDWVVDLAHRDLGVSYQRGVPVTRLLAVAIPPTLELAAFAYPLAVVVGVPLGAIAGMRPKSLFDWAMSVWTVAAISLPGFVLATLLLWVFAVELGWLPAAGRVSLIESPPESLRRTVLPAIALAVAEAAVITRFTRTAVAQVYREDFVRTARAKGLTERRVMVRHALRNALIPVITLGALQLGQLLSGAVLVEQVFTRPGMGRLMVEAVQNRDYAVVQGGLLVLVLGFLSLSLLADIAYGVADPRLRRR